MEILLTPSNVTFFIGIISVIFAVYLYFKKPQDKLELDQALIGKDLGDRATVLQQKEAEKKAELLAQQFDQEKEANEKKFIEFGLLLKDSLALAQNHIHTVDTKVDGLKVQMGDVEKGLVKLSTIIDERIPKAVKI